MGVKNSKTLVSVAVLILVVSFISPAISSPLSANADRGVSIPVTEQNSVVEIETPDTIGSNQDSVRFATITNNFNEQATFTITLTNSQSELEQIGFGDISQNSITITLSSGESQDIFVTTGNQVGNEISGPVTFIINVETVSGQTIQISEQNGPETRQGGGGGGGGGPPGGGGGGPPGQN